MLDAALDKLAETERAAILLRYFERKSAKEIGDLLQLSEEAAQKRVTRALERLRGLLVRQQAALSIASLAALVATRAVIAAPVGLSTSVSAAALAGGAVPQRVDSIDSLKQIGQQLRALAAANNLGTAFTADGRLDPNLIAGSHTNFDMKNVELVGSDPSQLPKLLQDGSDTVVARTAEAIHTPDDRWMRFYIQANGNVQNYSTPLSNQVFSANWQIEQLSP